MPLISIAILFIMIVQNLIYVTVTAIIIIIWGMETGEKKDQSKEEQRNHHVYYFKDIFKQCESLYPFTKKGNSSLDTGWLILSV